jgi:hypothetical protein
MLLPQIVEVRGVSLGVNYGTAPALRSTVLGTSLAAW